MRQARAVSAPTRILLVVADAFLAAQIERMLRGLGYAVIGKAADGSEAVELATRLLPDIILLDIGLAGSIDGIETASRIKAEITIPIVFLSDNEDARTIERARQTGPSGYLFKPLSPIGLLSTIDTALYHHRFESALRKSEDMYRTLVGLLPQRVCLRDRQGIYWSCNPRYAQDHGLEVESIVGRSVLDIFPKDLARTILEADHRVVETGIPEALEISYPFTDGPLARKSLSPVRGDSGEIEGVLVVIDDISEEKRLEREIRAAHLAMERKAEEERRRLSRELHDELGQLLTAIKLDASAIRSCPDSAELPDSIQRISASVDDAIERVRRLSFGLRPRILDDFGLGAAIESRLEVFAQRTGIRYEVRASTRTLSGASDESNALFRIFLELLTNVARHSRASRVSVFLSETDSAVSLLVSDDGIGMDTSRVQGPEALGFLGMRERAALFGGELHLRSAPGQGCSVEVVLPFGHGGNR